MANAKALAEHREEQLRKLKEELRRVQQEQDVTGKQISIEQSHILTVSTVFLRSRSGGGTSGLGIKCGPLVLSNRPSGHSPGHTHY